MEKQRDPKKALEGRTGEKEKDRRFAQGGLKMI
jgi:hypothetical protein